MRLKPLIISIKGTELTKRETILLKKERPWGIILFKRNLKSFAQIKKLTNQIKFITKNNKFPIIIDEEGSNVSRLNKLINHNLSSLFFGDLYKNIKKISFIIIRYFKRSWF